MGGRVQRSNPLQIIEREFLFDSSYVAMGTLGMNSGLCELQLRPEDRVRLTGYHTTPLKRRINQEARTSDGLVQMEEVAHYSTTGSKTEQTELCYCTMYKQVMFVNGAFICCISSLITHCDYNIHGLMALFFLPGQVL